MGESTNILQDEQTSNTGHQFWSLFKHSSISWTKMNRSPIVQTRTMVRVVSWSFSVCNPNTGDFCGNISTSKLWASAVSFVQSMTHEQAAETLNWKNSEEKSEEWTDNNEEILNVLQADQPLFTRGPKNSWNCICIVHHCQQMNRWTVLVCDSWDCELSNTDEIPENNDWVAVHCGNNESCWCCQCETLHSWVSFDWKCLDMLEIEHWIFTQCLSLVK